MMQVLVVTRSGVLMSQVKAREKMLAALPAVTAVLRMRWKGARRKARVCARLRALRDRRKQPGQVLLGRTMMAAEVRPRALPIHQAPRVKKKAEKRHVRDLQRTDLRMQAVVEQQATKAQAADLSLIPWYRQARCC
jgi:hypothetical protein